MKLLVDAANGCVTITSCDVRRICVSPTLLASRNQMLQTFREEQPSSWQGLDRPLQTSHLLQTKGFSQRRNQETCPRNAYWLGNQAIS